MVRKAACLATGLLLLLPGSAPVVAQGAGSPEEQRAAALKIFQEAIAHERKAADHYPFEEQEAIAELEAAAAKLDEIKSFPDLPSSVKTRASYAAAIDRETVETIPFTDQGDWEIIFQDLRLAMEVKREGVEEIRREQFKAKDRKSVPSVRATPPSCESQSETVTSCYKIDSWVIYVSLDARSARCDFRDSDGKRLTNLRPLFDEVVQRVTCSLTKKTKVVGGTEKRIVRAELRLTAISNTSPAGSNEVSVTARWR